MNRPLDPRLLQQASGARRLLATSSVLGLVGTGLVVAQAVVLAAVITAVFADDATLASQVSRILVLAGLVLARAGLAWSSDFLAHVISARSMSQLRDAVLVHVMRLGPAWLTRERSGELTTLCTRGVDSIEVYFSRYLPQVVLACIVPPVIVVVVAVLDPLSALLIALTVPLIPVFMAVVGAFTGRSVRRQWQSLAVLSHHFLDVVGGLTTLQLFGRERVQTQTLQTVGEHYRRTTMKVLRISFLSSLALELVATLSVAIVAVAIGLRLVNGSLDLRAGLTVLLLAPEAYLPLRMLAQQHHAAAEGVDAAHRMLDILDVPPPARGSRTAVPDLSTASIEVTGVSVRYDGRPEPALAETSFALAPGQVTAVVGPSGAGKSTLLSVLLGFTMPSTGAVSIRAIDGSSTSLDELDPDAWRMQLASLSQLPFLGPGSVADAVRAGAASTDDDVRRALSRAGLSIDLDVPIGEGGTGLSVGERRRVALARVFCRNAPLVLLDEPTSALDGDTEEDVLDAVRRLRADGKTIVVVAHRPALMLLADQWVVLGSSSTRASDDLVPAVTTDRTPDAPR